MTARVWLDDLHDWFRPHRAAARLPRAWRCHTDRFHHWPLIYRTGNGDYHILAPHREPHAGIWLGVGGLGIFGIGIGAAWLWQHVGRAAGVALGALAVPVAPLVFRLLDQPLEIIVHTDGLVVRRRAGGRLELLLRDYRIFHAVFVGKHGAATAEAERLQRGERLRQGVSDWHGRQAGQDPLAPPPMPPMPSRRPLYAEATEVAIIGPAGSFTLPLAEIDRDRSNQAMRLKAALEFVIGEAEMERARREAALRQFD